MDPTLYQLLQNNRIFMKFYDINILINKNKMQAKAGLGFSAVKIITVPPGLEWSFHSMNRPNNSPNTTIIIAPYFSKIIKSATFTSPFRHLKWEFRQNLRNTSQKTPSTSISSLKSILGPTKNKPPSTKWRFKSQKNVVLDGITPRPGISGWLKLVNSMKFAWNGHFMAWIEQPINSQNTTLLTDPHFLNYL